MSNDKSNISDKFGKGQISITLTKEQLAAIEKAFGPEMAKRVESVMVAQVGAGLQSMVVVN